MTTGTNPTTDINNENLEQNESKSIESADNPENQQPQNIDDSQNEFDEIYVGSDDDAEVIKPSASQLSRREELEQLLNPSAPQKKSETEKVNQNAQQPESPVNPFDDLNDLLTPEEKLKNLDELIEQRAKKLLNETLSEREAKTAERQFNSDLNSAYKAHIERASKLNVEGGLERVSKAQQNVNAMIAQAGFNSDEILPHIVQSVGDGSERLMLALAENPSLRKQFQEKLSLANQDRGFSLFSFLGRAAEKVKARKTKPAVSTASSDESLSSGGDIGNGIDALVKKYKELNAKRNGTELYKFRKELKAQGKLDEVTSNL